MGGLGATLDPVSPQVLISNLPASLQPSTTTFYFSPQQEAIQLQQAALMQTGKASFINGLSTDSTSQLTVNDQQKLVLYGNAVEYAKTNNIQLASYPTILERLRILLLEVLQKEMWKFQRDLLRKISMEKFCWMQMESRFRRLRSTRTGER
ncbi:hypothetical protein [Pandoraea sputorum]